jgi:acetolactate synthase small subunit
MNIFHIHYRNTQGTLMRILNAASRRAIEMPYVQAEPADTGHQVTLLLDVNPKQLGQLCRDWHAIVDVVDVRAGVPAEHWADLASDWAPTPHPPASAGVPRDMATRAAMA